MDFHEFEQERQMEQLHTNHVLHHRMKEMPNPLRRLTAGACVGGQIGLVTGGPLGVLAGLVIGSLAGLAIDTIADE